MSGLRPKALTPREIAAGCAPEFEFIKPEFEDCFDVVEDVDESRLPRSAKQFVKKHKRREARLRAKGRVA